MTNLDYILSSADLPFAIGSLDDDANRLFLACGKASNLMKALANADTHQDEVEAGDKVAEWISKHWRAVLPQLARRIAARELIAADDKYNSIEQLQARAKRDSNY